MDARTSMRWLVAFLLVCCYGATWCAAADISGQGRPWLEDFYTTLSDSYVFTQDSATLTYTDTSDVNASFASLDRGRISFVSVPAVLRSERKAAARGVLYSVPLAATAMVMAYNSSQFGAANTLVLDVATTAAMWRGDLTSWSDSRIAALNPWMTAPPTGDLRLVYCGDVDGEGDVLLRFLARVDGGLAALINGSNGGFQALEPVQAGRAVEACSTGDKVAALAAGATGVAFMMFPETRSGALAVASMRVTNSTGGAVVVAVTASSQTAVTNAMALTQDLHDIVNDGSNSSWPLAAIVSAVVDSDLGLAINNCYMIKHVFDFASWLQVNDGAIAQLGKLGYAALGSYHRRVTLEQMTDVTCNNKSVVSTSYLLGSGPPFEVYNALADEYSSAGFLLKYYESASSLQAIIDMIDSSSDFGTSGASLTAEQQALVPDAVSIPMMSYGIVFAYNLPGLLDEEPLVLDFQTVADIYMGNIASWNDSRIAALNPDIAHLLPNESIIVLYVTTTQVLISLANTAISMEVPEYAAAVGSSSRSDIYPVVSLDPNRTLAVSNLGATQTALNTVPYLFGASNTFAAGTRPNIAMASMRGSFSNNLALAPTKDSIVYAISNATDPSSQRIYFSPGSESWPIVATNDFIVRTRTMKSVVKAQGLAEWIYWIHSSESGQAIASANQVIPSGSSAVLMRRIVAAVVNITVDGVAVSPLAGCTDAEGVICSDRGNCSSGRCTCETGWEGRLCELVDSEAGSSSSETALIASLATIVPLAVLALCLLAACFVVALFVVYRRGRLDNYDWEIDPAELELGEQLGAGGYGVVHKALWKGTEVAVKMIGGESVAYDSVQVSNFRKEAQVMSVLRHPNVVLFMAACTKPPKMCIVMEFMALGSLFDLLHNDLIADIPMMLRLKIIYQAAKGMHFLHSSGVVHRDLKSLNLLLDTKWNVKVSDFGLTSYKEAISRGDDAPGVLGTVQWTAPEVLAEQQSDIESMRADTYMRADVYSLGIIMWEVLTRAEPYQGLLPAQVAVWVIKYNTRPSDLPDAGGKVGNNDMERDYIELMRSCWHQDPTVRPCFLDVMTRVSQISGDTITGTTSGQSSSSGSSFNSITATPTTTLSTGDTGFSRNEGRSGGASSVSTEEDAALAFARGRVPRTDVCFVVCDLARFDAVWHRDPATARSTISAYIEIVRQACRKHRGHLFSRPIFHSGGTFLVAFERSASALDFALEVRAAGARSSCGVSHLRIGISQHAGPSPPAADDPFKRGYQESCYASACRMCTSARGDGAIVCTADVARQLSAPPGKRFMRRGEAAALVVDATAESDSEREDDSENENEEDGDGTHRSAREDGLCSSNVCSFIISTEKLVRSDVKLGAGGYGRVWKGTYGGQTVAIKTLHAKMDETQLLAIREEAAMLHNIDHPYVVRFIGLALSTKDGTPMLVMEYAKGGNLERLLDSSTKLSWEDRMRILWTASLGLEALHTEFGITHRDIKPSNLLVDKSNGSYAIKIADFGFATYTQGNTATTHAGGTPLWTAPEFYGRAADSATAEVQEITNKADVFSFAMVIWQVLTRKLPYAEGSGGDPKNLNGVIEDILGNKRPPIPNDCPPDLAALIGKCWRRNPAKRPDMTTVSLFFGSMVGMTEP